MKISLAIEVADDSEHDIILESDGDDLLLRYTPGSQKYRLVHTNFPDLEIAVSYNPSSHGFSIFLVNKTTQKAVGYVGMRANRKLDYAVYEEKTVYFHKDYRKAGYMSALYRWFLNAGHIYMSDDYHSPGSHAVWNKLAKEYPAVVLNTKQWALEPWSNLTHKTTQMVLFGTGRNVRELEVLLLKVNK
jgi:hypothetical protein